MEELKNIVRSRAFKTTLFAIFGIIVVMIAFQAGVYVGTERAGFADRIGERYFRTLEGRNMGVMMTGNFDNAHGTAGTVVSVKLPFAVINDRSGIEKTVEISSSTAIRDADGDEAASAVAVGDFIVAFGSPASASSSDAVLVARLIRILPPPPAN
ncbi:MAG: hypothetical protein KGH93_01995 [Patescibacteria group bacterium]|nr:hypothetical protein [Patescibacteria group bacterium]MDE1945950.1 hypothetical protein [Patescibacteria group bacterium]